MLRKTVFAVLACAAVTAPTFAAAVAASSGDARAQGSAPPWPALLDTGTPQKAARAARRALTGPVFPLKDGFSWGTAENAFGGGRGHQGHDLLTSCGAPVIAAIAGRVTENKNDGAAGNLLVVSVRGGENYVYMHLQEPATPKVGERVSAGQPVGRVGQTGRASTCHLHFEWWTAPGWYKGGRAVDPGPKLRSLPQR